MVSRSGVPTPLVPRRWMLRQAPCSMRERFARNLRSDGGRGLAHSPFLALNRGFFSPNARKCARMRDVPAFMSKTCSIYSARYLSITSYRDCIRAKSFRAVARDLSYGMRPRTTRPPTVPVQFPLSVIRGQYPEARPELAFRSRIWQPNHALRRRPTEKKHQTSALNTCMGRRLLLGLSASRSIALESQIQ